VEVPDDANAFTIFETLNDRGLDLAISDLLKNYLFGLAGNRINEVQSRWISMASTIAAVEREEALVTFIRHLWSSKYGITREKDLYSEIKKKIRNKDQAITFSTELNENSKIYAAILNQDHELWLKYGPTARQHMGTLNLLQMIQIRPLVLAILDRFSVKETQQSLRLMVSWAVRFLISGGLGGGALETNYSNTAKEVREGKIKTAKQLGLSLKDIIPNDAQFKAAFSMATVSKVYLSRYYLRALERQTMGETNPELVIIDNVEVVNLEHVLPQNPSSGWNYISEEDRSLYVRRIGNLALLNARINTEAGNDSFTYKKQFYKRSRIKLTEMLSSYNKWDIDAINDRQLKLAELAIQTWPIK